LVLYGLEATGKTTIAKAVLEAISSTTDSLANASLSENGNLRYAIVKSAECISGRHLLEQIIGSVARAVDWEGSVPRAENLAQLAFGIGRLLEGWIPVDQDRYGKQRFILVFDGIDRQREAPPTLLSALARMSEIVSLEVPSSFLCLTISKIPNLTTIFIMTAPRPGFLQITGTPYIQFPPYTKAELLRILSMTEPKPELPEGIEETRTVWNHFCSAVWDSLAKHSGRNLLSFRSVCSRLWPAFIRPILNGTYSASPFSRLLVANRSLFQNDDLLVPTIVSEKTVMPNTINIKQQGIGTQLPYFSRLLLVAAYLASYNPPRTDQLFFMKSAAAKRRKKGGGTALSKGRTSKHRKISRKLLGPQAFVLERLLAIFHAIDSDVDGRGKYVPGKETGSGDADIQMAIATLQSLRLLVKMGSVNAGDTLDGGSKWKVAVGWEVIRTVARSVGVEAEDYLAE